MWGLSTAATSRAVISAGSIRSFECAAGDDDVELVEQLVGLVERPVREDVDLDARQDAERRVLVVQHRRSRRAAGGAARGQPVRDGQPWAVVRHDEVPVAEVAGGLGHVADGRAAVDQSEWQWQSPCRNARRATASGVSSSASATTADVSASCRSSAGRRPGVMGVGAAGRGAPARAPSGRFARSRAAAGPLELRRGTRACRRRGFGDDLRGRRADAVEPRQRARTGHRRELVGSTARMTSAGRRNACDL